MKGSLALPSSRSSFTFVAPRATCSRGAQTTSLRMVAGTRLPYQRPFYLAVAARGHARTSRGPAALPTRPREARFGLRPLTAASSPQNTSRCTLASVSALRSASSSCRPPRCAALLRFTFTATGKGLASSLHSSLAPFVHSAATLTHSRRSCSHSLARARRRPAPPTLLASHSSRCANVRPPTLAHALRSLRSHLLAPLAPAPPRRR